MRITDLTFEDYYVKHERLRVWKERIRELHTSSSYRYLRNGTRCWNIDYLGDEKEEKKSATQFARTKNKYSRHQTERN